MPLTKAQRRVLTAYRSYHDEGRFRLLVFFGPTYTKAMLVVVLLVVVLVWISLYVVGSPTPAALVVGILLGRFVADLRSYSYTQAVWPALDRVIDWQRVGEVLDQSP